MTGHRMDAARWQRVSTLFEAALDRPGRDRDAFVRAEAGADTDLRDTVLRMLRNDSESHLLDQSVDVLAAALLDESDEDAPTLSAGERVGDYEIEGVLGRGGMGIVYRARDIRLDRRAALKFLPASALDEGVTARVVAEARAASALDHPNIATIYHVGTAADARPFIAMAYYEGETLAGRLRNGALDPDEAVRISTAIAAGLAAAHQRGIVHRDVKPANIFLTGAGGVKLLDFGIAAGVDTESHASPQGTPLYMSPEQSRNTLPHPRSDVWSLGAVLYEMLAGRPPFEAASPGALRILKTGTLEPIPERPGITDELRTLVHRALAREPEARFPDAAAMHDELLKLPGAVGGLSGSVRRRAPWILRAAWVSAAIVFLAIGFVAVRGRGGSPAPPASPEVVAVFPFAVRAGSSYTYLREGIVDQLSTAFDGKGGLRSIDPRAIKTERGSGARDVPDPIQAAAIARKLGAGRFVLGEFTRAEGELRATASLYDVRGNLNAPVRAEVSGQDGVFRLVDRLAGQLLARRKEGPGRDVRMLAAETTPSLPALKAFLDGDDDLRSGRFDAASAAFESAVALDTGYALAYFGLANAAWWAERSDRVRAPAQRALQSAQSFPRAIRMQLEGLLARLDGDLDHAEGIYRQLIALAPEEPDAWYGLADVLHHYNPMRGRPLAEAVPYFERALNLQADNMSVRLHLANIAARQRNLARHDSLLAALPATGAFARFVRLVRAYVGHDSAAQASVTREFSGAESHAIGEALHYIVRLAHNPEGGLQFVDLLEAPGRVAADRATAKLYRAGLEVTLGRWSAAERELIAADSMGNRAGLPTLALWSLAPFVPADTARWRSLRLRLEKWGRLASAPEEARTDRAISEYLRGLLSVRLGDTLTARRLAKGLESAVIEREVSAPRNFSLAIRAELALRRNDRASALALLDQISPTPSINPLQEPVFGQAYERFQRAELLFAAGRERDALAWYQGQIEASRLEAIYNAPSYLRSARILERAGDSAGAAAQDRWYRELWSGADSAVAAWAVRARTQ